MSGETGEQENVQLYAFDGPTTIFPLPPSISKFSPSSPHLFRIAGVTRIRQPFENVFKATSSQPFHYQEG